jgi:hypothetical protein
VKRFPYKTVKELETVAQTKVEYEEGQVAAGRGKSSLPMRENSLLKALRIEIESESEEPSIFKDRRTKLLLSSRAQGKQARQTKLQESEALAVLQRRTATFPCAATATVAARRQTKVTSVELRAPLKRSRGQSL